VPTSVPTATSSTSPSDVPSGSGTIRDSSRSAAYVAPRSTGGSAGGSEPSDTVGSGIVACACTTDGVAVPPDWVCTVGAGIDAVAVTVSGSAVAPVPEKDGTAIVIPSRETIAPDAVWLTVPVDELEFSCR